MVDWLDIASASAAGTLVSASERDSAYRLAEACTISTLEDNEQHAPHQRARAQPVVAKEQHHYRAHHEQ